MLNRIESGGLHVDRHDVSLGELVRHTAEELAPLARRGGVDVEVRDCGQGVVVAGDAGHLHRAIVNVLSNAIKFTPAGGRVELSLEVVPTGADGEGPRVRMCCRDSGIGIPAADMAKLFTRFFRASNAVDAEIPAPGSACAIVKHDRGEPRRPAGRSSRSRGRAPPSGSCCRWRAGVTGAGGNAPVAVGASQGHRLACAHSLAH